ncbi:MAG TPA: hypothetical protein VE891_06225 [Allosphingosinicella sp.]|nr:hypothetical protein [Allosphingosinicella sp.]
MTVTGARAMRDSAPRGEGERRDSERRRRKRLILAVLIVISFVPGLYVGHQLGAASAEGRPFVWSPALAAMLAGLYLLATLGGGLVLGGLVDELDRQRSYQAVSVAGFALMTVYPTWFFLWKGGFVPEPIHWVLFLLFWLSLVLASLWYRYR